VTFTSSAAVRSFAALTGEMGVGDAVREAFSSTAVAACIGPITGEMAGSAGFERRCTPERGRLGLLVRWLATEFHARHRHLHSAGREVIVHGASIWSGRDQVLLTDLERLLFMAFAERPGVVLSRRMLRQRIWGPACGDSAIDSAVFRLRRVLQPVGLGVDTIHRRGWTLAAAVTECPDNVDVLVS
jgi:uroporphyrinogen-III synthase